MRVSTAFNKMLAISGAGVERVEFTEAGIVVGLRLRARTHRCPCGRKAPGYDHSRRRWRHLDLAACRLYLEADIWRVECRQCGQVRTEAVPWARPGARLSADLEDVIAWLCQRTDKTSVCRLLRVSWEAVQAVVMRVVAEHLDDSRLDGLYHLGVDEISYKRGHQYLTVIADHDRGRVVHVAQGRNHAALQGFFDLLGPERCQQVKAISMDMAKIWREPCAQFIPQADICIDPFHVIRLANIALDSVYTESGRRYGSPVAGRDWRRTRYALRAGAEQLNQDQHQLLNQLRRTRYGLWRAWDLKEGLRDLYRIVAPEDAAAYLKAWCKSALLSRLRPFRHLARTIQRHFAGIVAAVEHRLSNSRLEGINAKIRLINRRGYGHPNPHHLTAMIYLCLGGITISLPTET
ncbi:MAG: ISL3 family transposase [Actinobacteria bacterium]|nr:ISL3 family transposase [Actinomycetota bacterium]